MSDREPISSRTEGVEPTQKKLTLLTKARSIAGGILLAGVTSQAITPSAQAHFIDSPLGDNTMYQPGADLPPVVKNDQGGINIVIQNNPEGIPATSSTQPLPSASPEAPKPAPTQEVSQQSTILQSKPASPESKGAIPFIKPIPDLRIIPGVTLISEIANLPDVKLKESDPKTNTTLLYYDNLEIRRGDVVVFDSKTNRALMEIMDPAQSDGRVLTYPDISLILNRTHAQIIKRYPTGPGNEMIVTPTFTLRVKDNKALSIYTYTKISDITDHNLKETKAPTVEAAVNAILSNSLDDLMKNR